MKNINKKALEDYLEKEMNALLESVKNNRPDNVEQFLDIINSTRRYSVFNRKLIQHQLARLGLKPQYIMSKTQWKKFGYKVSRKYVGKGLAIFVLRKIRMTNSGAGLRWVNENPLTLFCSKTGVISPTLAKNLGVSFKYLKKLQTAQTDYISERLRSNYENGKHKGVLNQLSNFLLSRYGTDDIDTVFNIWYDQEPDGIQRHSFGIGEVYDIAQVEPIEPGKETKIMSPQASFEKQEDLISLFKQYAASTGTKIRENPASSPLETYSYDPADNTIILNMGNIQDDTGYLSALISGLALQALSERRGIAGEINKERFKTLCHVEMANYVICRHLGINNPYSPNYLAYMGTNIKELGASLTSVAKAADEIIEGLEPLLVKTRVESASAEAGLETLDLLDEINPGTTEEDEDHEVQEVQKVHAEVQEQGEEKPMEQSAESRHSEDIPSENFTDFEDHIDMIAQNQKKTRDPEKSEPKIREGNGKNNKKEKKNDDILPDDLFDFELEEIVDYDDMSR